VAAIATRAAPRYAVGGQRGLGMARSRL